MALEESSIRLDFPDTNFFRLEDCEGYKRIQHNLKEMDVCWYDEQTDILYLIELKDWSNNRLREEEDENVSAEEVEEIRRGISKYRIGNLVKKSIDTACMFASILLTQPAGLRIKDCAPFEITSATRVKLLSIINWDDNDLSYISNINTAYRSKFTSYAKLFGIETFLVLTKDRAAQQFAWVK